MIWRVLRKAVRGWRMKKDPIGYARSIGVNIGSGCRVYDLNEGTFGSEPYLVSIGDHVTVTAGVMFLTHDGGVDVLRRSYPGIDVFAPIRIGSQVFLGVNTILLPGVVVGDDSIIGAGSVVTRDVPPNCVAAGNPARIIKTTAEYKDSILSRAFLHTRNMSIRDKRAFLLKHFSDQK